MTHYRNYKVIVNNKPLDFFFEVEALSEQHIKEGKEYFIYEQTKMGRIKQGDKVEFKFMYANT